MLLIRLLVCTLVVIHIGALPILFAGEPIRLGGHSKPLRCVASDLEGRFVAAGGDTGEIMIWNTQTRMEVKSIRIRRSENGPIQSLAFSPDGKYLAAGGALTKVRVWETQKWTDIAALAPYNWQFQRVAFSRDGRHLVANKYTWTVGEWRVAGGLETTSDMVTSLALCPNSSIAAVASLHGIDGPRIVDLWDYSSWISTKSIGGLKSAGGNDLAFSPDGQFLACCNSSSDQEHPARIRLYASKTADPVREFGLPLPGRLLDVTFLDRDVLAVGGSFFAPDRTNVNDLRGSVYLLNVQTGEILREIVTHGPGVTGVCRINSESFATCGLDGQVQLWRHRLDEEPKP
jgi:WD40 repeat protein